MPIASRCDTQTGLVIDVYDGEVSFPEWREHIGGLLDDPSWLATTRSLSDLSTVRLAPLSDDDRVSMLSLFEARNVRVRGRRMAIVAGSVWGTAKDVERTAIARLHARPIVFSNVVTACVWLGVDELLVKTAIGELRGTLHDRDSAVEPGGKLPFSDLHPGSA